MLLFYFALALLLLVGPQEVASFSPPSAWKGHSFRHHKHRNHQVAWDLHGHGFPPSTHHPPQSSQPQPIISHENLENDYVVQKTDISTSGQSEIHQAQRKCDMTGQPTGEEVIIKASYDHEAMEREVHNLEHIMAHNNQQNSDVFCEIVDHNIPPPQEGGANELEQAGRMGKIVMEKGCQDLREHLKMYGPPRGEKLWKAVVQILQCVQAVHQGQRVWTDVKIQNFVVQDNGHIIKGIDLESAVPPGSEPIKWTPKASPPEFAMYLVGEDEHHSLSYEFDVWSVGIVLYELVMGHAFHQESCVVTISEKLQSHYPILSQMHDNLNSMNVDPMLQDLILQCLRKYPEERPSMEELLQHPYITQGYQPSSSTTSDMHGNHHQNSPSQMHHHANQEEVHANQAKQKHSSQPYQQQQQHLSAYDQQFQQYSTGHQLRQ